MPPPSLCFIPQANEVVYTASFRLNCPPSRCGGREIFIQMGAVVFTPPPVSFHFERGRLYSLPPVSFYFERGWWYSRRPLFLSISNRDSMWHSRCPPIPFCFEWGGSANPTRCPPFYFISNGGGVNPTRCPGFFLFAPYEGGILY